jgi:MSHA biogenesis protein MshQ
MDPLCASLYTAGTVSVTLAPSSGSWTPNPVFINKGLATAKLSNSAISGASLTLDGTINTNPLPNNTTIRCFDVSSGTPVENCTLPIDPTPCSSSLFNAAEPSAVVPDGAPAGTAPAVNLYTKLDGEPFAVDVLAMADPTTINASYSGTVTVDLVDTCPIATQTCKTVSTGTATQTITFPVNESAKGRMTTAPFVCPMAMTNAHVRIKPGASSNYVCSSDAFAVRPTAVQISYTDANGAALVPGLLRAGETPFSITTKVGTYDLSAGSGDLTDAVGYTGTLKFGTPDLGPMGTPPLVDGVAVPWTAGNFSSATLVPGANSGLTYSEVGLFSLAGYWPSSGSTSRDDSSARGIYDDTWTSFDSAQDDCIVGSYSNQLVGNKYGCNVGLVTSQTFGRFIPHHFETSVMGPMICTAEFKCVVATGERAVYSGQPFATTAVTAAAKSTGATRNFMGSYARDVVLSAWSEKDSKNAWASTAVTTGVLSPSVVSATSFISGVATTNPAVSGVVMPTPSFTFSNKATAPTDVVLRAATTETSGTPVSISAEVSSLQNPANLSIEGDVKVISGRLKISNATGSEKRTLTVPVQTQYWSGLAWVPNGADNTALPAEAVFRSDPPSGESVASKITPVTVTQTVPGQWVLTLPAPMTAGSADLTIALGALGSADYTSCLASHGGTPAGAPWLRSANGTCPAALAGTADPAARVTFGIYTPENRRQVHVRELY